MRFKTSALFVAIFVGGLAVGYALSAWQLNRAFQQWMTENSLTPVMSETTFGLQELRRGKPDALEATFDETVWRNMGLMSHQLTEGIALPSHLGRQLHYHCEYLQKQPAALEPARRIERQKICDQLLAEVAKQGS